jgi:plastocyanin
MRRTAQFALVGTALLVLGYDAVEANGRAGSPAAAIVTVTAGKPSEYRFTLSKVALLPSTVTFKVTNRGKVPHQFLVCTEPAGTTTANSCFGDSAKTLKPGQSTTLTVTFTKKGTFEFLSQTPGQAAKGMKGLIGIGVTLSGGSPGQTTTPSTSGTTPAAGGSPTTTTATGSGSSGASLFVSLGCSSCHSAAAAHAAGVLAPGINTSHTGGAFPQGPLTTDQINALAAYVNNS